MLHENTKKMKADYFEKTGITQKTFEKICYFCITRRKDRLIKKYDEKLNVRNNLYGIHSWARNEQKVILVSTRKKTINFI